MKDSSFEEQVKPSVQDTPVVSSNIEKPVNNAFVNKEDNSGMTCFILSVLVVVFAIFIRFVISHMKNVVLVTVAY